MTLGKIFNLFEPQFPYLQNEVTIISSPNRTVVEIEMRKGDEHLSGCHIVRET